MYTIGFARKKPCWKDAPAPLPNAYCVVVIRWWGRMEGTSFLGLIESTYPGTHPILVRGHAGVAGVGTESDLGLYGPELTDSRAIAGVLVTAVGDTLYEVYSINTNARAVQAFQNSFAPT